MEVPTKSLPHIERRSKCSASVPDHAQRILTRVGNWLFLRNAMTFEVGVAETPLHWAPFLRSLGCRPDQLRCSRLSWPGAPAFHRSSDAPLNGEAGNSTGFRAQLLFFLDDLIPKPFDKPLLSDKPDRSLIAWH